MGRTVAALLKSEFEVVKSLLWECNEFESWLLRRWDRNAVPTRESIADFDRHYRGLAELLSEQHHSQNTEDLVWGNTLKEANASTLKPRVLIEDCEPTWDPITTAHELVVYRAACLENVTSKARYFSTDWDEDSDPSRAQLLAIGRGIDSACREIRRWQSTAGLNAEIEVEFYKAMSLANGSTASIVVQPAEQPADLVAAPAAQENKSSADEVAALLRGFGEGTEHESIRKLAKKVAETNGKTCSQHTVRAAFRVLGWTVPKRSKKRRRVLTGNALKSVAVMPVDPADDMTIEQALTKIRAQGLAQDVESAIVHQLVEEGTKPAVAVEIARELRAGARAPKVPKTK